MQLKIEGDAEILPTTASRNNNVRIVSVLQNNEIIDCDSLQVQKNAIRPRIIEDVIVA